MTPLFNNKSYRHLLMAQITSLLGTGISTIALALLAYELAEDRAGSVLGTALALKMVAYVILAPVIGAWAHKLPRKQWLFGLDMIRAGMILCLPLVTEIWQIYLLILVINACSAGFTPVFQSVLPQVLPDKDQYMKALSLSRLAYDLEQLISPVLAGLLLSVMTFQGLFVADALTFVVSGLFIFTCSIPTSLTPKREKGIMNNLKFGISSYLKTPRLRALWGAYFAVAGASAMLIVNTVIYVREVLHSQEQYVAMAMSVAGFGSMVVALGLPRWLKTHTIRPVILAGSVFITTALGMGLFLPPWSGFLLVCVMSGMGISMVQTPAGALITRSCHGSDAPAFFSANFSLSHLCWFFTYLLAGWSSSQLGLAYSYAIMMFISLAGALYTLTVFPKHDPDELLHWHPAAEAGQEPIQHSHRFVIDQEHRHWPSV